MTIRLPDDDATEINLTFKITDTEGNQLLLKELLKIPLKEPVSFLSVVL